MRGWTHTSGWKLHSKLLRLGQAQTTKNAFARSFSDQAQGSRKCTRPEKSAGFFTIWMQKVNPSKVNPGFTVDLNFER